MFLNTKKRISELIDTVSEMLVILYKLNDPANAVSDCLVALETIVSQLNSEELVPEKSIKQLKSIQLTLYEFLNGYTVINKNSAKMLNSQVLLLKTIFQKEIKTKLKIVFFPYKASMWDSLATVYEAATSDEDSVVRVVPIPYYQLTQDKAIPIYEGESFPKNIPITHYSNYNLEEEQPDIIFVHNIYDQYNTITRVYEQYFTSNLKKYTDMLVYVPYHISSFIEPRKGEQRLAYDIPSVWNIDKIILVSDFMKKAAIRDGIPEEKLLVFGSPKLDAMSNIMKENIPIPKGWKDKLEGKIVYLLNTDCMFWTDPKFNSFSKLPLIIDIFNITRYIENSALIWRPHPLTNAAVMKYAPYFYNYYNSLLENIRKGENKFLSGIILDESPDYLPALKAADVIISGDGSLLRSFLLTEKKVLFLDKEMPKNSLIPSNAFYYFYNEDEPWYKLVKKFSTGYDPLAENRRGLAAKVYTNTDGTCGEKVYKAIKDCVLKKN